MLSVATQSVTYLPVGCVDLLRLETLMGMEPRVTEDSLFQSILTR
jgi:hypothetical protein